MYILCNYKIGSRDVQFIYVCQNIRQMDTLKNDSTKNLNELEQFYKQKKDEALALRKLLDQLEKEHQKTIINLKTRK